VERNGLAISIRFEEDTDMRVRVKNDAVRLAALEGVGHSLTEQREYFVIDIFEDSFRVIDDEGEPIIYPKVLFETCDASLPPNWQFAQKTGDTDYYLGPRSTSTPGFYEDYFCSSGDIAAQSRARKVVRAMLEEAFAWGQEADKLVLERDLLRMEQTFEPKIRR